MSRNPTSKTTRHKPKAFLRLPDLDQAKSAVLNSLTSADAQRGYRHAIDEFMEWYCSEPRLSFSRIVVLRYRIHLEARHLAPGTINLRLGAVRRLAYEAADCGLLSPDLAAGIRRVKGLKKIGVRFVGQRFWVWLQTLFPPQARSPAIGGDGWMRRDPTRIVCWLTGYPDIEPITSESSKKRLGEHHPTR